MLQTAINKLEEETEQNKENAYVTFIAEYLVDYIKNKPSLANNILAEGKHILGSLDYMKTKAKEISKDGMAMFSPKEGFEIVLDYYGINEIAEVKTNNKKINISLDDLL